MDRLDRETVAVFQRTEEHGSEEDEKLFGIIKKR